MEEQSFKAKATLREKMTYINKGGEREREWMNEPEVNRERDKDRQWGYIDIQR